MHARPPKQSKMIEVRLTNIAHAFELVEKMKATDSGRLHLDDWGNRWGANFALGNPPVHDWRLNVEHANPATAITIAAILAVRAGKKEKAC